MKILNCSPMGVYPPKGGGHQRIHNLNLELSKKGNEIFLFSQGIRAYELKRPLKSWTTKITNTYVEYRYVNYISILANATTQSIEKPPIFSSEILNLFKPSILEEQVEQNEIIKIENPWQFDYLFKLNSKYRKPIVLVEHDVQFELIPHKKLILLSKILYKHIVRKEKFALEKSNIIFTTSNEDKYKLMDKYDIDGGKFHVIPNGVNTSDFSLCSDVEKEAEKHNIGFKGKKLILFAGSKHPPNAEAAKQIVKIASKFKDDNLCFLVIGRAGDYIKNMVNNVFVTGFVEDIIKYFIAADIAINPMLTGSGTNIKVLEYLAAGLPTITTPTGARGLALENNTHAIIADIDDFPRSIKELLNDENKQIKLIKNGRRLVEQKYDWRHIAEKEDKILKKFCETY